MPHATAGPRANSDASCRFSTPAVAAVVAAAVLLHVYVNGYAFGGCTDKLLVTSPSGDHANVLPWIHWHQDHSLYPRDFEITMGAAYATVLWPAVAVIARVVPLEWTFLLLHLASLAASYLLLFLLARRLAATDAAGVLACLFFVVSRDGPAGESTHDAAFYTRGAALPMALLCLWLVLRGRAVAGFAVLALTVAVHSLTAFYVAPIALCTWLFTPGLSRIKRFAPPIAGLVAAALIAWSVGGGQHTRLGAPSEIWLQLQRGNNVMHVFPRAWSQAVWHDLAACGLFLLPPLLGGPSVARRLAMATLLTAAALAALGWVTSEWLASMLFMQLQPLRGLKLTILVSLLCAAAEAATARNRLGRAAALLCIVGLIARQNLIVVVAAGLLLIAPPRRAIRWAALAAPAAVLAWFIMTEARPVGETSMMWGATLVIVPFVLGMIGDRLPRAALPCGVGILAAIALAVQPLRLQPDKNLFYTRNLDFPFVARTSPWIDVQRWIAAHAPLDALVLSPPILEGFRTYARRSEFVDWKQGTLSMFNEAFGVEWQRRLVRLMPRQLDRRAAYNLALNYDALGPPELAALARDCGITHVVVTHRRPLAPLIDLYDNGAFRVIALR